MKLFTKLPGLLLCLCCLFFIFVIFSGQYDKLLNPKYFILSAIATLLMGAMGIALLLSRHLHIDKGTLVFFGLLMSCFGFTGNYLISFSPIDKTTAQSILPATGGEYEPINLGELFLLKNELSKQAPKKYVIRGIIHRSEELDAAGYIAISRVAINCCLADAQSLGIIMKTDNPDAHQKGDWVYAYGTVQQHQFQNQKMLNFKSILQLMPGQPMITLASLNPDLIMMAEKIDNVEPPNDVFMFQFKMMPPHAF